MARRLTSQETLWRAQLESAVQQTLTDTAEALSVSWHHETDSRKSRRGWPDIAIAAYPVLWIIECKKEVEQLEPEQRVWREDLVRCREVRYRVARPSNVGEIVDEIVKGRAER